MRNLQNRRKKQESLGAEIVKMTKKNQLTPQESAQLRKSIHDYVATHLQEANDVVMGRIQWSPTQARVFSTLLNKVVPDLNASFVQHEHSTKPLRELSREELEAIAQGESTTQVQGEVIDNDSQKPNE